MTISTPKSAGPCTGYRDGEVAVAEGDERWFRACPRHADFWDEEYGAPSSKMFGLSSGDSGELSGTRSSKVTAEDTYNYLASGRNRAVAEIRSISVDVLAADALHVHDDSAAIAPAPASPHGHAFLDLRHLPTGRGKSARFERESVRALLLDRSDVAYRPVA